MTGEDYLLKTKSSVVHLFDGVEEYSELVERSVPPVYLGSGILSEEAEAAKFDAWQTEHAESIEAALEAQKDFLAEWYAMAALCGAMLEIAVQGIELCNPTGAIPTGFEDVVKSGARAERFCVGRIVRTVPLGLVVLAARNQHAHHGDKNFNPVVERVFDRLATEHGYPIAAGIPDPAFDLQLRKLDTYAHNVTALIEWRKYAQYESDMSTMLGRN